jgi:hypothetical protein
MTMTELESLKAQLAKLQELVAKNEQLRRDLAPKADMNEIKVGMSSESAKRVAAAILAALREGQ